MLLTRKEMTFDFAGAKFELPRDREVLGWIFSQFLYGEVTGIQVGHWIQEAPTLDAADFLAKQCIQELVHIKTFRRCFEILGVAPQPPHRVVRLLSTDFIGGTFEEHVALEMAQGEGMVLQIFYALCDTIAQPEITRLLERAAKQEEEHCGFGEQETAKAIAARPKLRRHLLGINLAGLLVARRFADRIGAVLDPTHPVLRHAPDYLRFAVACAETRLRRLGLLERPIAEMGRLETWRLVVGGLVRRHARRLWPFRRRRLTDTYLRDPRIAPLLTPS